MESTVMSPRELIRTDVRQGYAAWADSYDAYDNPMIAAVERFLDSRPLPFGGARVLDIGCGTGRALARALGSGARSALGIDGSSAMLARAEERLAPAITDDRVRLLQAELESDWPGIPADFDLAVITLVLEHAASVAPIIARAARHVRANGLLFVAEIHPDMLAGGVGAHFERDGVTIALPSYPHDRAEFGAALTSAGFTDCAFEEIRADPQTIAAIPKFAKRAGQGVLLALRARRSASP
jgi:SAM-dependent methyltransferase